MTFRNLSVLGITAAFLLAGEFALEVRAAFRGFDSMIVGRLWPSASEPAGGSLFGPTQDFPFRSRFVERGEKEGVWIWLASSSYAADDNFTPDAAFPGLMAVELEGLTGHRVIALNASAGGKSIQANVEDLRRDGPSWRPDIAVLYQLTNDLYGLAPLYPNTGGESSVESASLVHRQANQLERVYESSTIFAQLSANFIPRILRHARLPERLAPEADSAFEARVVTFIDAARDLGALPVLATVATRFSSSEGPSRLDEQWTLRWNPSLSTNGYVSLVSRWNEILREVAAEEQVLVVDVAGAVSGTDEYFTDPVHFTAAGHAAVAEVLASHLIEHVREIGGARR